MKPTRLNTERKAAALGSVAAVLVVSLALSGLLWTHTRAGVSFCETSLSSLVCWLLVIAGIGGTALASSGRRFGWLLLFGLQPLWIAYALCSDQSGLVLGSVAYAAAQLNGFLRRDESAKDLEACPSHCS